jgi:hypothetical protein
MTSIVLQPAACSFVEIEQRKYTPNLRFPKLPQEQNGKANTPNPLNFKDLANQTSLPPHSSL